MSLGILLPQTGMLGGGSPPPPPPPPPPFSPGWYIRADSLREYLTGALVDAGGQSDPTKSLGGYRSTTEAVSLGIAIANAISGVTILYAGGANPPGPGILTAIDSSHLTWQPFGDTTPGPAVSFSGINDAEIVEANSGAGSYLRVLGTPPFSAGASTITLGYLYDNVFGFDDVSITNAGLQINEYRATIIRNESSRQVSTLQRWIATLAPQQISTGGGLSGGGGAGTIITSGSFAAWPKTGWCQVASSLGNIKEVVYYSSRTNSILTVPANGRAVLGTSFAAGSSTDILYSVPGVAIGIDPAGIQAFGSGIQAVSTMNMAPSGVTWNLGVQVTTGLQIGTLSSNQQVGIWMWRQTPAGLVSTPFALIKLLDSFNAF